MSRTDLPRSGSTSVSKTQLETLKHRVGDKTWTNDFWLQTKDWFSLWITQPDQNLCSKLLTYCETDELKIEYFESESVDYYRRVRLKSNKLPIGIVRCYIQLPAAHVSFLDRYIEYVQ